MSAFYANANSGLCNQVDQITGVSSSNCNKNALREMVQTGDVVRALEMAREDWLLECKRNKGNNVYNNNCGELIKNITIKAKSAGNVYHSRIEDLYVYGLKPHPEHKWLRPLLNRILFTDCH